MEQTENEKYIVDIQRVLNAKAKRKFPKFFVNFLKRRLHQDELNDCILHAEHPHGIGFFDEALKYLDIHYNVRGAENLDINKKCIFAANHPLGGPEALIMGSVMRKYYGESFRVPVNDILAYFPPLSDFFTPVNAINNKQSRSISENISKMFESEYQILIYPAGKCARKEHGRITEQPWKKMFITQARKYQRDVVPVHMTGINSRFFYFVSKVSKLLGMKVNLGMFMLVDELFKKKHQTFTITFGKPIPWQTFDKSKTDQEWASWTKEKMTELEPEGFQQNV